VIGRPLIKIVLVVAVVGFFAFELGSPVLARLQIDGVAHEAADEGSKALYQSRNPDQAREVAVEVAAKRGTQLKGPVGIDQAQNTVSLTVEREARSVLFKRWSVTRDWYSVEVSASSNARGL
jgi:hypothetical protein